MIPFFHLFKVQKNTKNKTTTTKDYYTNIKVLFRKLKYNPSYHQLVKYQNKGR